MLKIAKECKSQTQVSDDVFLRERWVPWEAWGLISAFYGVVLVWLWHVRRYKQANDAKLNRANTVDQLRFFGGWLSPDIHAQLTDRVRLANSEGWKVHQVIERQADSGVRFFGAPLLCWALVHSHSVDHSSLSMREMICIKRKLRNYGWRLIYKFGSNHSAFGRYTPSADIWSRSDCEIDPAREKRWESIRWLLTGSTGVFLIALSSLSHRSATVLLRTNLNLIFSASL